MISENIEELKKARRKEITKRRNQIPLALCVTALALAAFGMFLGLNVNYGLLWLVGIVIGMVMQRSRFCFAASFRDPIMVGSTSILKAILIAFMISTVGFFIIQYRAVGHLTDYDIGSVPGIIKPVGLATIVGAILFGTGMVIAGGCASGTLMRVGEGYMMQIITLIGFVIGATLGARHFEFWDRIFISKNKPIYIPKHIGFFPAFILQMTILIGLYMAARWYDNKHSIMAK